MRTMLAKLFVDTVEKNKNAYLLSGDHGYALFDPLRKTFPDHFLNAGVAEQNMVGVAAGMAKAGMLPIVYGLGAFVPVRVLEQIKLDVCFEKLKVIFIGDGAGAIYTTLGVSHQTFEDIASLRAIPNIKIFSPCDAFELEWCFNEALAYDGPSYIRIGKSDLPVVYNNTQAVSSGGMTKLVEGKKDSPVIMATGSMVSVAVKMLEDESFKGYSLYSVGQIKPLTNKSFEFLKDYTSGIITIEEHNHIGGLGSAVVEVVTSTFPRKVMRIGSDDCFTKHCGSYQHVMKEHGLDLDSIKNKIKAMEL